MLINFNICETYVLQTFTLEWVFHFYWLELCGVIFLIKEWQTWLGDGGYAILESGKKISCEELAVPWPPAGNASFVSK